jgi:hypothetical protein
MLALTVLVATASAQVQLPESNTALPIAISAQAGNQWQLGQYEVWVLRGDCRIQQGDGYARCQEAVLWIDRAAATERQPNKVITYLEGNVEVMPKAGATRLTDKTWLGRFFTSARVEVHAATVAGKPDQLPPIYWRGMERRSPESANNADPSQAKQVQYAAPADTSPFPAERPGMTPVAAPPPQTSAPGVMIGAGRQLRIYPRSDMPVNAQLYPNPNSQQQVIVIDSGVNVIVDMDASVPGAGHVGTLDVSADRIVIWTAGLTDSNLSSGSAMQDPRTQLEFYLEGNIVFRQGERIIYADRMYYDVPNHVGTVLNADMLSPVRSYEGLLRLHSDVLQQTAQDKYYAKNTFLTSSRLGDPSYRLQAGDVYFEDVERPAVDPIGQPLIDPATGKQIVDHQRLATASNNVIFIGSVPVFYWPILSTDLNEPTYYIRRAALGQDDVFGSQVLTHWSGYQLLGIRNKPQGTDFDVSLDYLSKRGFGYGGTFSYDRDDLFDFPGHVAGLADAWAIQDRGNDNLGEGRRNVPPEATYRYRLFGQHRQMLPYDIQLSAELGWISDRNFLEEYYKSEWEQLKDETTGIELKHLSENRSLSLSADYRLNDFFTETNWLPRLDHFWLGQSLGDVFTWYEHSNASYAQLRHTTIPANTINGPGTGAAGPFNFLPWEPNDVQGERLATRQEIDWPFQMGPVKVVPYALGEASHWGQDIDGTSFDRLFGQVGIRSSLPMWSVDPTVSSDLFNVHGIAHKVVFEVEAAFADANRNLTDLPLYDPLDDDSVEAWRRRFLTTTFGIPSLSPLPFPPGTPWVPTADERLYALRTGLQNWVSSPSTEIADDLSTVRFGVDQRWQTKRGPAQNRQIIDWITLDSNVTLFPNPDRDNFGTVAGLLDYDFRWHVGDRLTLVSDAIFDFFDQGQKVISVGGFLSRPPRGSLYAGFRIIEGPTNLNSQVLTLSYNYWMSPKWISSFGTSIDFGNQGNLGENFSITRVGESFLVSVGCTVDPARNNVGAALLIEPRFLPKGRLGNTAGVEIPPAGALGLE